VSAPPGTGRLLPELAADPIFVLGLARSGTTWVYELLTAHPQVSGIFESSLFSVHAGVGGLFQASHWRTSGRGLGQLLSRDELVSAVRVLLAPILRRAIEDGRPYLVEKSPEHVHCLPLLAELLPESRFVHVLRDGRDVAVSVRAAAHSWAPEWRDGFARSTSSVARNWKAALRKVSEHAPALGDRFHEVRFEELRAHPEPALAKLWDFCGLPYDRALLRHALMATDFASRFPQDERRFRRAGRSGDWKRQMGVLAALQFNWVAGDDLIAQGYCRDRLWMPRLMSPERSSIALRRAFERFFATGTRRRQLAAAFKSWLMGALRQVRSEHAGSPAEKPDGRS
jgi:hypothetical protein